MCFSKKLAVIVMLSGLNGCAVVGSLADHQIEEKGGYMQGRAEEESFSQTGMEIDIAVANAVIDLFQPEPTEIEVNCEIINGTEFCYQ